MNTSSESPSSRPMTLRQQLVACFYDEQIEADTEQWEKAEEHIEYFDTRAVIDRLEKVCQEIAREADQRLLRTLRSVQTEVKEELEYITDIEGIDIPQVWQQKIIKPIDFAYQQIELELTQKPPQPKENT